MTYAVIDLPIKYGNERPHPWVARLMGLDSTFGFKREFVKGVHDYTYATKSGKNVWLYFALAPQYIYEVYAPVSRKHSDRFFAKVEQSTLVRISREEVIEWLKKNDT